MNFRILLSCFFLLAFFTQNINAQETEKKEKRKMTIVTKKIDKDGKETTTTVVKEGDEVSDEEIDKIIQEAIGEGKEIDVEVEVESQKEGTEKIIIKEKGEKGVQQKYRIIKKSQDVEIESDGDHDFIKLGDDDENEDIKEVKIIKKDDGKMEITVETLEEGEEKEGNTKMIFIGEDGEVQEMDDQDIKIIKKKSADGKNMEITIESAEGDEDDKMIWIEKTEGEEGDVIIIEEETTEEKDKDGNTIKKTVKKKKKIVKKEKND